MKDTMTQKLEFSEEIMVVLMIQLSPLVWRLVLTPG
jgi:hypothetical protein